MNQNEIRAIGSILNVEPSEVAEAFRIIEQRKKDAESLAESHRAGLVLNGRYWVSGLDDNCQPVQLQVRLVSFIPEPDRVTHVLHDGTVSVQDIVIKSEGILIKDSSLSLSE